MLEAVVAKRWGGNSGAHNLWRRTLALEPKAARQGLESGHTLIVYGVLGTFA